MGNDGKEGKFSGTEKILPMSGRGTISSSDPDVVE
jgi:hypothetical protein